MSTKNVILKKKIEGVVYDLMIKTSAAQVDYDETHSVAEKITSLITDIGTKANQADVITAITASATNGKITYTKNGSNTDVAVKGAVVDPTYVSETRTLTLPVVQADGTTQNVVMALGKDMFVKSGNYNASTKKIVLTLTDDSTIEIPASSLVDIYTGGTTNSVVVSVSEGNEITADVRVSSKEGNIAQIITESGKEGIYVPEAEEITVDSALSTTSENPVQNKVVKSELDKKIDKDGSKVLSDNNYTTEEKTKLAGLSNYDDSALQTAVSAKARIIVSATQPSDLTDNDIWAQEV